MSQDKFEKALQSCKNSIGYDWDSMVDEVRDAWDERQTEHDEEVEKLENEIEELKDKLNEHQ